MSRTYAMIAAALVGAVALNGCQPGKGAARGTVAAQEVPVAMDEGAREYQPCAACHQANGAGLPGQFPPLAASEWVNGPAEIPIAILLHGLQGEITVNGQHYNSAKTPWAHLQDRQIAAVLTHIRSSWGNAAPPVTADDVARVRQATLGRGRPWTVEELKGATFN